MSTAVLSARLKPPEPLEQRIARFAAADRRHLRDLALMNSRQAQLLTSFPAASLAFARRRGPVLARAEAMWAVRDGAGLKEIAALLDLPPWLRRLPPEALHHPLPDAFLSAVEESSFWRRIAPVAPATFQPGASWLHLVLRARRQAGADFSVWLAQKLTPHGAPPSRICDLLGAFASASQAETSPVHREIWSPNASLVSALAGLREWLIASVIQHRVEPFTVRQAVDRSYRLDDYAFDPMKSYEAMALAGVALDNCLRSCARRLACGASRFFNIRYAGSLVAAVEIAQPRRESGAFRVMQLAGPGNHEVDAHIVDAVEVWLERLNTHVCYAQKRREAVSFPWSRLWPGADAAAFADLPQDGMPLNTVLLDCLIEIETLIETQSEPRSRRARQFMRNMLGAA